MLNEHTLDQLRALRLDGMVHALEDLASSTAAAELPFDDRLTLLVQREIAWRDDRRVARLLKAAKLKVSAACIEDINWRASRGLDRGLISNLAGGDWLRHARNLLITGATGSGKTWLACALAHQAARSGFSVQYVRAARLFDELQVARCRSSRCPATACAWRLPVSSRWAASSSGWKPHCANYHARSSGASGKMRCGWTCAAWKRPTSRRLCSNCRCWQRWRHRHPVPEP